jgi:hypothetical protein
MGGSDVRFAALQNNVFDLKINSGSPIVAMVEPAESRP